MKVESVLFRIPMQVLRGSPYFEEMFDSKHIGTHTEGMSDDEPITLGGISAFEMENLLEVLEARSVTEWMPV